MLEFQGCDAHIFFVKTVEIRIVCEADAISGGFQGHVVGEGIVEEVDPSQNDVIPKGDPHFLLESVQQIRAVDTEPIGDILHAYVLAAVGADVFQNAVDQRVLDHTVGVFGGAARNDLIDAAQDLYDLANGEGLTERAFLTGGVKEGGEECVKTVRPRRFGHPSRRFSNAKRYSR